jgi:GT2 family glycosyltransferase/glycosyltransferase involved in cell wall biosynthesis/Flp pilus assembly protein TadD
MTRPRVYYLCPDDDAPSGGIRVIYRHVDVLNDAGVPAAVLHSAPGFRCTWFEHATRIEYAGQAALDGAVVAIPEIYGPGIGGLFPGVRKVVFNQNAYNTFNGYAAGQEAAAYRHPEVEAALVVSEDSADYLRLAFPGLRVLRTVNRIDPALFAPAELRRRRIAFMPRRGARDAAQALAILGARGALDGVDVVALDGLGEQEVAAALHDTLIFLSLGTAEGCPTPPKEAMASGCLTVGYTGQGGREFMLPGVAYPIEAGAVVELARTVEQLLAAHPGDPAPLPAAGRAAAELIRERHSPEHERESVLAAWRELLGADAREAPPASIAILTLNGLAHTRACLESVERCTAEPHELVLVDNGSTDGTVDFLRAFAAKRPHVRLVLNAENRGFAGGNNQALALATGRHVVLLNNDTVVTPGWLSRLVDAVDGTPGAGLAGPVSNFVSGPQLVEAGYVTLGDLDRWACGWAAAHEGEVEHVGRLVGFCLLLCREVVDAVGALDERFGAGNFEDDDLCLRARSAGFHAVIARDCFVHHTGNRTFVGQRIDYAASLDRNRAIFEAKWGSPLAAILRDGPAAIDQARLEEHRFLPLPAAEFATPGLGHVSETTGRESHDVQGVSGEASASANTPGVRHVSETVRGEARVEALLLRARDAVHARDLETLAVCFAETREWDEPQRSYQAVRHLCELVLAAGERIHDDGWIDLYERAADGLLGVLEATPAEPVLLNFAGVLLFELTLAGAATALFEAGLRLDPELPAAADNLDAARRQTVRLDRPGAALAARALRVADAARPAEGLTLSLCMIVKDEEEMLAGCLAAAAQAVDEIVVVDTGSTDRTVEIAESFGARVVHFPWNGSFADARNVSLEHATGDWVIYLDADEHLDDGAARALRALLGRTWREAFYLRETNLTGADDAGSAVAHPAMRVFRNRPEYRFEGRIHEQKTRLMPTYLPERFEVTSIGVRHFGYLKSRVAARDKSRRNLELLEAEARESSSPFLAFNLGSEHQMRGDWELAAASFDEAWAALHREPEWHTAGYAPLLAVRAGRARRECGRIAEARELLAEAAGVWPDYTDVHFELAVCAQAMGDLDEAERLLRHCLELGDAPPRFVATIGAGSHVALGVLGEIAEARGDLAAAEDYYRRALGTFPTFTAPVVPLAALLVGSGRPAEAERTLRAALERQPGNDAARVALLQALIAQRRYGEAADAAAAEPPGSPVGALAAACELLARAAAGDAAGLADALGRAALADVAAPELAVYRAWADDLGGRPLPELPAASFEPALGAVEELLAAREKPALAALLRVVDRIDVPPDVRRDRLAHLVSRHDHPAAALA